MLKNTVLALSLAVVSTLSHAYFQDGNKLRAWAEADDRVTAGRPTGSDYHDSSQFMGYVTGVYDFADGLNLYCTGGPGKLTVGQVTAVVKKYLYGNPEVWSNSGDSIVIAAMKKSFPCPTK